MAKETKVIHVHLIFKKTSRFFGSISAIYSEFTAEEIGITEETLRHKGCPMVFPSLLKKRSYNKECLFEAHENSILSRCNVFLYLN